MNLKNIKDQDLIHRTESLARAERELLTRILRHLEEIQRRRLFSSMGYKSLFEFAVKKLGYPEDQAYRRLSAMRLLKEIPQIEEKINAGEISLTHINLAQSHFRQEKKTSSKDLSVSEKLSVIEQIANKPVREAERITFSLSSAPELLKTDRVKLISDDFIELKFKALIRVLDKIERLKGRLAHKHPNLSTGELFDKLCDLGLAEWDPSQGPKSKSRSNSDRAGSEEKTSPKKFAAPRKSCVGNRAISIRTRRQLFKRANNQCENCKSEFALEVDHILPFALGGSSSLENLRVVCRSCNQGSAIRALGQVKMDKYLI